MPPAPISPARPSPGVPAPAMLTRMVDASLRLTPDWDAADAYVAPPGTTLASLVPAGTLHLRSLYG